VVLLIFLREAKSSLDRLEEWAHVNLMKFNMTKCKVLHFRLGNTHCQYRLGDDWIKSCAAEEDFGIHSV